MIINFKSRESLTANASAVSHSVDITCLVLIRTTCFYKHYFSSGSHDFKTGQQWPWRDPHRAVTHKVTLSKFFIRMCEHFCCTSGRFRFRNCTRETEYRDWASSFPVYSPCLTRFLWTPKRILEMHLRTNTDYVLLHKSVFQSLTHWKLYCWESINRQTLIELTAVNSVSFSKKNGQTTNSKRLKHTVTPSQQTCLLIILFLFFPSCIIQTSRYFFYSSCFSVCFLSCFFFLCLFTFLIFVL